MRVVTRMWSAMDRTSHVMDMFSDWVRSRPSVELLVGIRKVALSSHGVCISFARKTRDKVSTTRSRFLKVRFKN